MFFSSLQVTIDVLRDIYKNDSSLIRRGLYYKTQEDIKPIVKKYHEKGVSLDQMSVIDAGWHCSWCFKPQGIRAKLLDAPNSDFPRFGDDRARTDVAYIRRLIKHGGMTYGIMSGVCIWPSLRD